jgi:hypothetical protein
VGAECLADSLLVAAEKEAVLHIPHALLVCHGAAGSAEDDRKKAPPRSGNFDVNILV